MTDALWDDTLGPEPAPGSTAAAPLRPPALPDRYTVRAFVAAGGMGEVWRVDDRVLGRTLVAKVQRQDRDVTAQAASRFADEARRTARLEHPAIVPVHDLGQIPDGRWFFTMKEVRGRTLRDALTEGPVRRRIARVHRATEAVAFAHRRGVAHLDLKPSNLMIGEHGELLVLDWGLSAALGAGGAAAGTPGWMAPEQEAGARVGPGADVFALGAILHAVLVGRPPRVGAGAAGLPATAPDGTVGDAEWAALVDLCARCLVRDPAARPSAAVLATDLGAWLDGEARLGRARQLLLQADAADREASAARREASDLREAAARALADVPGHASAEAKEAAWALEDRGAEQLRDAADATDRRDELLRAALRQADLPEAHARLAAIHRAAVVEAEATGDDARARRHLAALSRHDRAGAHRAFLAGTGWLHLTSEPPGAEVHLARYVERRRRRVAAPHGFLGRTPVDAPIGAGRWRLTLTAPGRAPVHLPLLVRRGERITLVRPGDAAPTPVVLPARCDGARVVPAGWTVQGGDPGCVSGDARRVWVDAFAMATDPVTHADWLAWLNALVADGREDEAAERVPRELGGGGTAYRRTADGYTLGSDPDGDAWHPDWPVFLVTWHDAVAHARWRAARDGLPWRLPTSHEWEKAARGADARLFPWGDRADPGFCVMAGSHAVAARPAPVGTHPVDLSPYGVRGLAGNMRDWCGDGVGSPPTFLPDGAIAPAADPDDGLPMKAVRGGSWMSQASRIRAASVGGASPTLRRAAIGVRLARSLP